VYYNRKPIIDGPRAPVEGIKTALIKQNNSE